MHIYPHTHRCTDTQAHTPGAAVAAAAAEYLSPRKETNSKVSSVEILDGIACIGCY